LSNEFSIDFHVDINTALLQGKFDARTQQAQAFLDSEVLRQSKPFVPFVQGTLANTAVVESPGKLVYVQVYARRMYYGESFNFTKTFNPDAGARWTDRAKAAFLSDWRAGVESILRGGNR
jgi:hypothetical protein